MTKSLPEARCACGAVFTDPFRAAAHWKESEHAGAWSIPSTWLTGRPWGLVALFDSILSDPFLLPDPPAELADAWLRFQRGDHVEDHEARALDEWRTDCARDAGF